MSLLGCVRKKSCNEHPLINENNRHKYNFGKIKNYNTEFLILLNEEDLLDKSIFCFNKGIKTKLLNKKCNFPGKLNIIRFDEIQNENSYIIEDMPIPKEIYMKLPNKNLYVLSSKYNLEYFYSKQNELKNIFILLGAKKIIMKNIKKNNNKKLVSSQIEVNCPNINVGNSIYLENNNSIYNKEDTEMTFDYDETIMNNIHPEMFSDKNFFFLPKEDKWQDIIIRRLEKNLITDKHTFKYSNHLTFNGKFMAKLKMIDINFSYNTEEFDNLEIVYEFEYHNTISTNTIIEVFLTRFEGNNSGNSFAFISKSFFGGRYLSSLLNLLYV